jgi:hypothetical protein
MENLARKAEHQLVLWQATCDNWGFNSPTAQRILAYINPHYRV